MTSVYIIPLVGNRYYVGKSQDPAKRYEAHLAGKGAAWTKLHKPIAGPQILPGTGAFDEDRVVKELMAEHGIDNVRGGSYSKLVLTDDQVRALQAEIWASTDKCIRCGRSSHFIANCYAKTDVDGNVLDDGEQDESEIAAAPVQSPDLGAIIGSAIGRAIAAAFGQVQVPTPAPIQPTETKVKCKKCWRHGHVASNCYAKTRVDGSAI